MIQRKRINFLLCERFGYVIACKSAKMLFLGFFDGDFSRYTSEDFFDLSLNWPSLQIPKITRNVCMKWHQCPKHWFNSTTEMKIEINKTKFRQIFSQFVSWFLYTAKHESNQNQLIPEIKHNKIFLLIYLFYLCTYIHYVRSKNRKRTIFIINCLLTTTNFN